MKIGDLVKLKNPNWSTLGIIIDISGYAEVLWCNSDFVYLEPLESLEVVKLVEQVGKKVWNVVRADGSITSEWILNLVPYRIETK